MKKLEEGKIVNLDENWMVGYYWLRDFDIVFIKEIKNEIFIILEVIEIFVKKVYSGEIKLLFVFKFIDILFIGIGGLVLGF